MDGACQLRILEDAALGGPENMARDEALLECVGAGSSPPSLRLYEWREPTISLGYFQPASELARLDAPLRDLPVVRRLTGGGAILHDLELTYSLTLPLVPASPPGGPNALYERVHDAAIRLLRELGVAAWRGCASDDSGAAKGPFFCFARRHCYDVLVGRDKIAGSAQRRTTRAVLQHGSLLVGSRFTQHPVALIDWPTSDILRRLRDDLPAGIAQNLGMRAGPGAWRDGELETAATLLHKYAGESWTCRI